jgi:DTW domain-containing protein
MRPSCPHCLRAQTGCICHLIAKVQSDVEVLILQHPMEMTETKGTARLLHLCLPNSSILIGEVYGEEYGEEFKEKLLSTKYSILLYPSTPEDYSLGIQTPPKINPSSLMNLKNIRLIIIDGTWRKSRKILCKNKYLQTLPRLVLNDLPAGQYTIRKARKPHQLSTLEAASVALTQLENANEGDSEKYTSLMQAFIAFNAFIFLQMKR